MLSFFLQRMADSRVGGLGRLQIMIQCMTIGEVSQTNLTRRDRHILRQYQHHKVDIGSLVGIHCSINILLGLSYQQVGSLAIRVRLIQMESPCCVYAMIDISHFERGILQGYVVIFVCTKQPLLDLFIPNRLYTKSYKQLMRV